jgi:hypothetical protein
LSDFPYDISVRDGSTAKELDPDLDLIEYRAWIFSSCTYRGEIQTEAGKWASL